MPIKARILIALLSFFLFIFVLNLIRKRKMRVEYSILWFFISAIILTISAFYKLGDSIAYLLGIHYPPALFFFIAILFIVAILMHFSLEMTKLKDQNKNLIQELSLLKSSTNKKK
jgi:hypothetical protein